MATEPPYPLANAPVDRWTYDRDRATDARDRESARREYREDLSRLETRLGDALEDAVSTLTTAADAQDKRQAARSGDLAKAVEAMRDELRTLRAESDRRAGVKLTLGTLPVILTALAALGSIGMVLLTLTGNVG